MCLSVIQAQVWTADRLVFVSPALSTAGQYNVAVQLDGSLSAPAHDQTFEVLDDPVLNAFEGGTKTHIGDVLQLSVCHLPMLSACLHTYTRAY